MSVLHLLGWQIYQPPFVETVSNISLSLYIHLILFTITPHEHVVCITTCKLIGQIGSHSACNLNLREKANQTNSSIINHIFHSCYPLTCVVARTPLEYLICSTSSKLMWQISSQCVIRSQRTRLLNIELFFVVPWFRSLTLFSLYFYLCCFVLLLIIDVSFV